MNDQLLLPAGCQLTVEILDDLISQAKTVSYKRHSLWQYGSIKIDVLNFIATHPYNVIFSDQSSIDNVLNLMGNIYLISPVIQSLDYFKQTDFYTYRHTINVLALCILLSEVMMSEYWVRLNEAVSSPIHDIGKTCIPLNILKKSSPLTYKEKSIIEHHTVAGYILLSYYFQDAGNIFAGIARDHHERGDGSGYPRGIKLRNYIVEVIAACDVYDALISPRPYRSVSYDNRTAIEEITEMGERNILNPEVIKALVSINRKLKTHYSDCEVSKEKRGKPPLNNNYGVFENDNN
jgi:HD-GYP domain-containing protein (c-di-GMP phosphodiesterase class II)